MSFAKRLKRNFVFKALYRLKVLVRFYHYGAAFLGALFFRFPSKEILTIGITGTMEKTTMLYILYIILEEAGFKTALLSSLYVKIGNEKEKNVTDNTMPGRMFIQRFLRRAVRAKCDVALIEVTSEGVVMSRDKFIDWKVGVINNLAPEHIEAHGSFEKYREAKEKFLKKVYQSGGRVFINRENAALEFFRSFFSGENAVWFSKKDLQNEIDSIDGDVYVLRTDFNQENLAASVAVARHLRIPEDIIWRAVKNFEGVPGRMEFIQKKPYGVVVDYAHTPDSLEKVYANLKSEYKKLICVLGSAGGGRDKWKRAKMGEIADKFCDEIILTNEDPYDEDPLKIVEEVGEGVKNKKPRKVLDRGEAIKEAINLVSLSEVVVITGKGSELYIHLAEGEKVAWSDTQLAKEFLEKNL